MSAGVLAQERKGNHSSEARKDWRPTEPLIHHLRTQAMDYHRIYREFIADRKARETELVGYTEKHHIIPRGHGGTDDPANLIDLTPEDHFFAHLCWAKAVDTMAAWSAVMVMHERDRRSDIFKRKARERYGWARRRYGLWCAEARKGEANPNHKAELVALKHSDGRELALTRSQWRAEHGVEHAALCGVMTGKVQSHYGWMLPDTNPSNTGRAYAGRQRRSKTTYHWRHVDGREIVATPFDLAEANNLRCGDVTSVARGEHAMCFGWSIVGSKTGWPCGRQHFKDVRVHTLVHCDGQQVRGTQIELRPLTGLSQQEVSAVVTGDRKSAGGWMTDTVAVSGYRPRSLVRSLAA